MSSAEHQAEKHSHVTGIPIHECGHKPEDGKLPRRVSRRADARFKISQHNVSATLMENETDIITSADKVTSGTNI